MSAGRSTDKGYTIVLCSACNQPAHVFDPHIVVTPVRPLDEEDVDVMIAFLADVLRNVTFAVTMSQNVRANVGVQFFEFRDVFHGHGEVKAGQVECV